MLLVIRFRVRPDSAGREAGFLQSRYERVAAMRQLIKTRFGEDVSYNGALNEKDFEEHVGLKGVYDQLEELHNQFLDRLNDLGR